MIKKLTYILLGLAMMTACEVIPVDERTLQLDPQEWVGSNKRHLLIEFTGVQCVNCPKAAEEVHNLMTQYGENLVVVAMHPASNPFTKAKYPYDYTCPAADYYYQLMGGTATTSFPTGNIDMLRDADGGYFCDYTAWSTHLANVMADSAQIDITVDAEWKDNNAISVSTQIVPVQNCIPLGIRVFTWLIEDEVVGAQYMPDGTANMEYVHRHMLRGSLENEEGVLQSLNSLSGIYSTQTYTVPQTVNHDNCYVVVVVTDENMTEVLNVYQSYILNNL